MLNRQHAGYASNETRWMKRTLAEMHGAVRRADFRRPIRLRTQASLFVEEEGGISVDCPIRYEDLQDLFAIICRRIGILEPPLPILSATAHSPYVTMTTLNCGGW